MLLFKRCITLLFYSFRSFLLLACILGTQILLTDAQGRTGRPGVGDTRRVQAALREFGIGDNLPGSPGKAFNLSEFLRILGENPSGSPLSSPGPVTTTTTRPTGRPGTTSTAGSTTVTRTSTSAPATDQGVSAQTLAAIELEFADLFRNSVSKSKRKIQSYLQLIKLRKKLSRRKLFLIFCFFTKL